MASCVEYKVFGATDFGAFPICTPGIFCGVDICRSFGVFHDDIKLEDICTLCCIYDHLCHGVFNFQEQI